MAARERMTRAQKIRALRTFNAQHASGAAIPAQKEISGGIAGRDEPRRFFELSHDLLCIAGFGGVIRLCNPAWEKVMGYAPDGLRGRVCWTLLHRDDAGRAREAMRRLLLAGRPGPALEARVRRRDGEYRWLMWHAQVFARDEAVYFTGRDITDHKRVEASLAEAEARYRALAAHLRSVTETERARVAREIHDELGALLTTIKMELSWQAEARHETGMLLRSALLPLIGRFDEAITVVRRIATALRPSILDSMGVWAAIEWLAEDFGRRTGLRVELAFDPLEPACDPDVERASALFRIAQEALTNVARHAHASRVTLSVATEPRAARLTVADDGVGIDRARARDPLSYGIIGMLERASTLGGAFAIAPGGDAGTVVSVEIPMT